jgi:ADP-ribosylglycohydrolase
MKKPTIIGAIAGDVIGSVFEWDNVKTTEFKLFSKYSDYTDDSVLTMAVADCILNNQDFAQTLWNYGRNYAGRGYGNTFSAWLCFPDPKPYNSFGNGAAMRVSAVGYAYHTLEMVMREAKKSAEVSHNHPEGIKGAQATAVAIYLARTGKSKQEIQEYISSCFGYHLNFTLDEIRDTYQFNETCQETVPQAIVAFLESTDYENAIRLAISIGGDSDTLACITGGIAAAYYKEIPQIIIENVRAVLPEEFLAIIDAFDEKYG